MATPAQHSASWRQSPAVVAGFLGVAQIFAWGCSVYLVAVLARPIAAETGWPLELIFGGLSLGFAVSSFVSPLVGSLIQSHGGRPVLMTSSALFTVGLVVLALAHRPATYLGGWAVLGLAMGSGLYDPAFASLGRLYGREARAAITYTTLYGGFASTVCWPLAALIVGHAGWRVACLGFAAINLLVCLPLYAFGLPRPPPAPPTAVPAPAPASPAHTPRARLGAMVTLALSMALAALIAGAVSVQLPMLLEAQGLSLLRAVALAGLFGPAQVGARVLEATIGRRFHPLVSLLVASLATAGGLALLGFGESLLGLGVVVYGAGSGIRSIARGTVPLALFGPEGYARLMGRLALPALLAQAVAPLLAAVALRHVGLAAMLPLFAAAAGANALLAVALLLRYRPARSRG